MMQELIFQHGDNQYVDTIPKDCSCCLVLNGYKTISSDEATKITRKLNQFIKREGKNTQVYSIIYKPSRNQVIIDLFKSIILNPKTSYKLSYSVLAKILFLAQGLNRIGFHQYINEIFDRTILPRITDENGNRLPVSVAKQNVRNITLLSHCYGGYIAKRMVRLMTKKLQKLKYSDAEIDEITRQMVAISQSPVYIFNDPKYSMLNFTSASDTSLYYKSFFQMKDSMQFFKEYNLIMSESVVQNHKHIKQRNHTDTEHIIWPLKNSSFLSESGNKIIFLLRTVLSNAFDSNQIDGIESLFKSDGEKLNGVTAAQIFEQLKNNSCDFCKPKPRCDTVQIFLHSVFNKIASIEKSKTI